MVCGGISCTCSHIKGARSCHSVGDEGGFAPALKSDEEAIETILEAVRRQVMSRARISRLPWMPHHQSEE